MRYFITSCICVAVSTSPLAIPASGQEGVAPTTQSIGIADSKTKGAAIRASQLIGMNIVNSSNKSVGKVHDIVLNGSNGKVQYLAVTYGGFLGFGDKLFAVPYEAFQHRTDPEDRTKHRLVLDVTQEQLDGAQGFDQNSWPDFADEKFTSELDRRYRIERRDHGGNKGVDININRRGVEVDVNP